MTHFFKPFNEFGAIYCPSCCFYIGKNSVAPSRCNVVWFWSFRLHPNNKPPPQSAHLPLWKPNRWWKKSKRWTSLCWSQQREVRPATLTQSFCRRHCRPLCIWGVFMFLQNDLGMEQAVGFVHFWTPCLRHLVHESDSRRTGQVTESTWDQNITKLFKIFREDYNEETLGSRSDVRGLIPLMKLVSLLYFMSETTCDFFSTEPPVIISMEYFRNTSRI